MSSIIHRQGSLDPVRRHMNRLFGDLERQLADPFSLATRFPDPFLRTEDKEMSVAMNMDCHEDASGYSLTTDLPGVQRSDVSVDLDDSGNTVTVTAEKKKEHEEKSGEGEAGPRYHFAERSWGKCSRTVRLPENADLSGGSASLANGVLSLRFPKKDVPMPRSLEIKAGPEEAEKATPAPSG